jgi:transposase
VSRKLSRPKMRAFFSRIEPCVVGKEVCGSAHYWVRELRAVGHEALLMPPSYTKPYVKRGKNDAVDERWYAGVDWGSQSHCVFLTDDQGRKLGQKFFKHSGEGLAEMAAWLLKTNGAEEAGRVLVAIEVPHGPVVENLIERGFTVHAINPKQMDRFRHRFSRPGAKDDSRDAEVMASALRTDPRCFRKLSCADPVLVELREWSRIAEELGVERNRLANRLREQLWRYFPALFELKEDCGAEWLLEFLVLAPTPAKAARLREAKIAELLKQRRIRRLDPSVPYVDGRPWQALFWLLWCYLLKRAINGVLDGRSL